MTDWNRVAAPQPDGYDLSVIRRFANARWGWSPAPADAPMVSRGPGEGFEPASFEEVESVLAVLDCWPLGAKAVSGLVDFATYWRATGDVGVGCSCGHWVPPETEGRTVIFTTVNDPVGGAEGLVHEMGHLRLHALGVDLEAHDGRLLANRDDELYESPIRKDKLRPMSAVLQAQYSYVWVTALDLAVGDRAAAHLATNLPRIVEGRATIARDARWTDAGAAFWAGFVDWTDRVVGEGRSRLAS